MGDKFAVLVVDDDPGIRETMADILSEMDFKVTTASDGYQAIDIIKDGSFDAVVMDIKMPGIDGIETLRRIKRTTTRAKFILMTAYASQDAVVAAGMEGASSLLYKPIDIPQLVTLITDG